jgi:hypothetical protein
VHDIVHHFEWLQRDTKCAAVMPARFRPGKWGEADDEE